MLHNTRTAQKYYYCFSKIYGKVYSDWDIGITTENKPYNEQQKSRYLAGRKAGLPFFICRPAL